MGQGITRWCAVLALGLTLNSMGCAKAPGGGGSGVRLVVTMRLNGPVNDNYYYFFLIRNAGDDIGRNGPIPVIEPPYGGNGFATGRLPGNAGDAAFTDFVQYHRPSISGSGYTLFHVPGGIQGNPAVANLFAPRGDPANTVPPNGGNVLQFELDLSQIQPSPGEVAPNPDNRPRYLQVNFITTTRTPANATIPDDLFYTDAIGDQSSGPGTGSFNTYITIDTSQIGKTYQSTLTPGPEEPTGDTFYRDQDPRVDIVFWSVQVVGR